MPGQHITVNLGLIFAELLNMKKYWLVILILLFTVCTVKANHTKGGWMSYEYLGPGTTNPSYLLYKISVHLYVECNTTVPEPEWTFTIFRGLPPYTQLQNIPAPQATSVSTQNCVLPECHPCIENVPTICYWIKTYETTVELAPSTDGYIITKERCCRVTGITNLASPSNSFGEAYTIRIPGSMTGVPNAQQNSSPQFIFNDTALVCANNYFSINFTATDKDGDSLVYYFCDAYTGGSNTGNGASPNPASAPPYSYVSYAGIFTGSKPLGPNVSINSKTGVISGIAPGLGEYVVCVCVSEYRNGVHFADSRKEIHLYVRNCNPVSAKLKPRAATCDGFTVDFSNATEGINPVGTDFFWDFGDPASGTSNTSTLPNPIHTYSDTGVYILKLKVSLNGQCADSGTVPVRVYPGFFPDFDVFGQCKNTPIQFTDKTTAKYGNVNFWDWNFGDYGSPTNTSPLKNPTHNYATSNNYTVTLIVASDKGCIDTLAKTVIITDKPAINAGRDTLICSVDTLQLHATGTGSFLWSPNYMISSLTIPDPFVSPDITTDYIVQLTDPFGCSGFDTIRINVVDRVTQSLVPDTTICRTDPIILRLNSDALYFQWTETPAGGNTLSSTTIKNPTATPLVNTTYHVVGSIGKCIAQNDIAVKVVPYPLANAGPDQVICPGGSAQLNATGGSIYFWSPAAFLNNRNIPNPISVNPTASIRYIVSVSDVLGCPKSVRDTMIVTVDRITADAGPSDTSVVLGQPLLLHATGSNHYLWSPATWLNNIAISTPVSLPQNDITYKVRVSNDVGCFDEDTIRVHVYFIEPGFYVPNAFTPNGDGKNDRFRPIAIGMKSVDIFRVYNRWGQLLYASSDMNGAGWDGTFRSKGQDPDTYVWYAEGTDYKNNKVRKRGYVILVRE